MTTQINVGARSALENSLIADTPRLAPDEQAFMREIFDRVLVTGRARYAPWVAGAETRNLARETDEEIFDAVIYAAMLVVRRRVKADRVRRFAEALVEPSASFECVDGAVNEVLR